MRSRSSRSGSVARGQAQFGLNLPYATFIVRELPADGHRKSGGRTGKVVSASAQLPRPAGWLEVSAPSSNPPEGMLSKAAREIMEIRESSDPTRCNWSAAQLAGCDPKTVARLVTIHNTGGGVR